MFIDVVWQMIVFSRGVRFIEFDVK